MFGFPGEKKTKKKTHENKKLTQREFQKRIPEIKGCSSPFMLGLLVCVHVLQFVQLWVEDGHVSVSLEQRRTELLVLLSAERNNDYQLTDTHTQTHTQTVDENLTHQWEMTDLSAQSHHLLPRLHIFRFLLTLNNTSDFHHLNSFYIS